MNDSNPNELLKRAEDNINQLKKRFENIKSEQYVKEYQQLPLPEGFAKTHLREKEIRKNQKETFDYVYDRRQKFYCDKYRSIVQKSGPTIRDNLQFNTIIEILNFNILELEYLLKLVQQKLRDIMQEHNEKQQQFAPQQGNFDLNDKSSQLSEFLGKVLQLSTYPEDIAGDECWRCLEQYFVEEKGLEWADFDFGDEQPSGFYFLALQMSGFSVDRFYVGCPTPYFLNLEELEDLQRYLEGGPSGDPNSTIYNYVLVYQQLYKMLENPQEEMDAAQLIDALSEQFGFENFEDLIEKLSQQLNLKEKLQNFKGNYLDKMRQEFDFQQLEKKKLENDRETRLQQNNQFEMNQKINEQREELKYVDRVAQRIREWISWFEAVLDQKTRIQRLLQKVRDAKKEQLEQQEGQCVV